MTAPRPKNKPCPCPTCGVERWYRDMGQVRVHAAKSCKSCAMTKRWENPTDRQVAASKVVAANMGAGNRGRTASDETRAKLRAVRKGRRPALGMRHTEESRQRISDGNRGRKDTPEQLQRRSAAAHLHYGTEPDTTKPYTRKQLDHWAHLVYKRDHGTCQQCGFKKKGERSICAHHLLSKALHPEFALHVGNGVTLCQPCHVEFHSLNGII
jgi:5-methylcytosine-specific restriction endonuclease McrA